MQSKSVIVGIMLTAGSAIGAGMFSLPIVSSGMWFVMSLVTLLVIWCLSYLMSLTLLEVNLHYPVGSSFNTFVEDIMGRTWNIITGLCVAFLMYILLYAYFSAFGNMVTHTLDLHEIGNNRWTNGLMSLFFGGLLSTIVWKSTSLVGRLSTLLVVGMAITFIISMSGLSLQTEVSNLLNTGEQEHGYFAYIWASLPYFLTSFGFATIVPSLYKYYGNKPDQIRKGLFYGSLLALLVYGLFIFVAFGLIARADFLVINQSGGNMGELVSAMTQNSRGETINSALTIFSNFAIISSFLGVGLGLFDYVADRFDFSDNGKGRFYSACITFLPPGIASFFFPHGFIAAIGFAALVVVFAYIVLPVIMVYKKRRIAPPNGFRLWGGTPLLVTIFALGILIAVCHILSMLDFLPKY